MDYKTIRDYITKYYINDGDGKIYTLKDHKVIEDEKIKVEAMLSIFLYTEARKIHSGISNKLGIDEIIERVIALYGVNGTKNDTPQNRIIWNILSSEGHLEETVTGDGDIGNQYEFLTGKNNQFGLTLLRYLARQQGFDIENFETNVDSSEFQNSGTSKITIDFSKRPIQMETAKPEATKPLQAEEEQPLAAEPKPVEKQTTTTEPSPKTVDEQPVKEQPIATDKQKFSYQGLLNRFTKTAEKVKKTYRDLQGKIKSKPNTNEDNLTPEGQALLKDFEGQLANAIEAKDEISIERLQNIIEQIKKDHQVNKVETQEPTPQPTILEDEQSKSRPSIVAQESTLLEKEQIKSTPGTPSTEQISNTLKDLEERAAAAELAGDEVTANSIRTTIAQINKDNPVNQKSEISFDYLLNELKNAIDKNDTEDMEAIISLIKLNFPYKEILDAVKDLELAIQYGSSTDVENMLNRVKQSNENKTQTTETPKTI